MPRGRGRRTWFVALSGIVLACVVTACGQPSSNTSATSQGADAPSLGTCATTAPLRPVNTMATSGTELLKRSLPTSDDGPLPAVTGGLLCIYDTDWPGPLMRHATLDVGTASTIAAMIEILPRPVGFIPTSCPGFPTVPPIWIVLHLGGHTVDFTYLGNLPECGGIATSNSNFYPQNSTAGKFQPLADEIEKLAGGSPYDLRAFSTRFSNASSP